MPPKRRRYHGLYFHSSPPKILPMNGNAFAGRQRDEINDGIVVKPSNIRIWIHDKDIGKLTRVLWAGQGNRLRSEASTNPRVRRFLENVPYFMNVIKSVHQAVIDNDLELLQNKLDDPPPALVTTKDANGLSVMHKAAGLGHTKIVEYLIKVWPNGVSTIDATGKTPLHWAASAKDNIRIYNLLVQAGSYEETMDYRMKVPQYYRMKPQEIDKSFLYVVPDAPRVPQYTQPDWSTLVDDIGRLEGSAPKFYYPESRSNSVEVAEPDFYNREESPNNNDDNASTIDIQSKENITIELTNGIITPPISPQPPESDSDEINDSSKKNDDFDEVNGNINNEENITQNEEMVLENDKTDDKSNEDEKSNKDDKSIDNDDEKSNDDFDDTAKSNDDVNIDDTAKSNDDDSKTDINDASDNEDVLITEDDQENDEINNNERTSEEIEIDNNKIMNKKEEIEDENDVINDKENIELSNEEAQAIKDEVEEINEEVTPNEINEINDNIRNEEAINDNVDDDEMDVENELLPNDKESNEIESDIKKDIKKDSNIVEIENNIEKNEINKAEDRENEDDDDDDQVLDVVINDIDENHNSAIKSTSGSPSPPLEIEGLIQGEADDNQVQSQSAEIDDETKIKSIIDTGDMEQLALIVLNGEGNKLIDTHSNQADIQAFLDNVPAYMNKIRRVHQAAKDGNLRDLQSALDRRKFAIAKDEISPNGATPLHVATVFGHAGIVRYLAGRFPETTTAVDENGRTALHYAATINDNGHFYNLLTHFGANSKATDKLGNIPDYYKNQDQSKDILGHKQLLKSFGANESLEEAMLNDQVPDDLHSSRRILIDEDILSTLERCYRLIHDPINAIPNPIAKNHGSASSLRHSVTSYLARFLKRSIFDKIKRRQTKLDHNLFDIIWPAMKKSSKERRIDEDLNGGIVAPDFDVFVVFQEFLVPLIKDMHCMTLSQEFKPHPRLFYFPLVDGEKNNHINYNIDESGKYIIDGFIECSRNLDDFELPLNLNIGQIEQVERILIEKILTTEFAQIINENESGTYYTMNEVLENSSDIRNILIHSKLMIPLLLNTNNDPHEEAESIALNGQYWPYGRGVFISYNCDLAAWINVQEHLRIIVCSPTNRPGNIGAAYSKIGRAMTYLEEKIHFRESYFLGYLASRPSYLGTSLKISTILILPNLIKEIENLRHLCLVRGLNMLPNIKNDIVRVVNMQSLGTTEWRLFQDYSTAVSNILQLEKDMSLTNSKQIAAMLVKIFKRKKNSLSDI